MLTTVIAGCGTDIDVQADVQADAADDIRNDADEFIKPGPVEVDENFRVIYSYSPVLGDGTPEVLVADPRAGSGTPGFPAWQENCRIGETSLSAAGLDCELGCIPSQDLRYMAVMTESTEGTLGQTLVVVNFDKNTMAATVMAGPYERVRQAAFSGSTLFMSRFKLDCETGNGTEKICYRFQSVNLDENGATPKDLFVFPESNLLENSLYSGRFRLFDNLQKIVIQNLEKESRTFWVYDGEELRQVGEKICQTFSLSGECAYSENAPSMTDDDPVLLTGEKLIYSHVRDNMELGFGVIDLDTGAQKWSILLKTPKKFSLNACYNMRSSFIYTRIMQPLIASADGSEVIFTAASECDGSIGKSFTNILAISIDDIGTTGTETAGNDFFRNITVFPQESTPDCISITSDTLSLSPSGRFLSFVGTAIRDSSGQPLNQDMPQHKIDREVFITSTDGLSWPIQISGDLDFRASDTLCSPDNPWFAPVTDPKKE